jgi:predicted protein tyrosine phosphatase
VKLSVYSRQMIEIIKPYDEGHLIISIRTPGDPKEAKLPRNEFTYGVLQLQFHDIIAADEEAEKEVEKEGKYILFNDRMAKIILCFVTSNMTPPVEHILVHCDAGVSRSAGVAAALAKAVYGQDDSEFFSRYHPNRRVYRAILNAHASTCTPT